MISFNSYFKNQFSDFINYKKSLGYDYESQTLKLKKFDDYLYQKNNNIITKETITDFMDNLDVNRASKSAYASIIRQVAIYLNNHEINCYLLPQKLYTRGNETKEPHIYTEDEIIRIFKSINDYYKNNIQKRDTILLFFKILYCTGLRVSECCNIKIENINFEEHTISILDTKNGSDRSIVVSEELNNELKQLNNTYNINCTINDYFFRRNNGKPYNRKDIYPIFRKVLYNARIPHTENGPTVHHFRHTFCVNSLKKIVDNGLDINTYIPILCAYLGHNNYASLAYYLRLTNIISDDIRNILESYTNDIIRETDENE